MLSELLLPGNSYKNKMQHQRWMSPRYGLFAEGITDWQTKPFLKFVVQKITVIFMLRFQKAAQNMSKLTFVPIFGHQFVQTFPYDNLCQSYHLGSLVVSREGLFAYCFPFFYDRSRPRSRPAMCEMWKTLRAGFPPSEIRTASAGICNRKIVCFR